MPKKPLYPWQQYEKTQQNLIRRERRKQLVDKVGSQVIERQRYLLSQPGGYTQGTMEGKNLESMVKELYREFATVAKDTGKRIGTSRQSARHLTKAKVTERVKNLPAITGLQRGSFEFMEGRQTETLEEPVHKPRHDRYRIRRDRNDDLAVMPDTGSMELDTLLLESAALAGYKTRPGHVIAATLPSARIEKITLAIRAREQGLAGGPKEARKVTVGRRPTQAQQNFDNSRGLGTSNSVGAGTLLGS